MAGRTVGWWSGGRVASLCLLALAVLPAVAHAQNDSDSQSDAAAEEATAAGDTTEATGEDGGRGSAWLPNRSVFWDLLAPPRANGMWASLIGFELEEGPFSGGRTTAAEVQLAYLLVVRRFQGEAESRPGLDLGVEFIITPRFNLDEPQKDLINTDFRIGIPFSLAYDRFQARFGYLHESSHLGDETILRFTLGTLEQSTRDALELTVTYQVAALGRVYAGGGWNWNHSASNEGVVGWAGLELDPGRINPTIVVWPYAAADFRVTDLTNRVAGSLVGGAAWRVAKRIVRLELRGHFGPSPMGQFRAVDEEYIGIALRFDAFPPP